MDKNPPSHGEKAPHNENKVAKGPHMVECLYFFPGWKRVPTLAPYPPAGATADVDPRVSIIKSYKWQCCDFIRVPINAMVNEYHILYLCIDYAALQQPNTMVE